MGILLPCVLLTPKNASYNEDAQQVFAAHVTENQLHLPWTPSSDCQAPFIPLARASFRLPTTHYSFVWLQTSPVAYRFNNLLFLSWS